MKRIVSWFAANPVATNLLAGFALLAGIAAFARIPVQTYPDIDVPVIAIAVPYPGAAPEEVESDVCARIDEHLSGIDGIDRLRSTAREGLCQVRAELLFDADGAAVLNEVQSRVNAIDTLPAQTETPIARLLSPSGVVIEVAVAGPSDERALKELARRVRDDLLALPGITRASVASVRPYEISVEVSEASLRKHNLTFEKIAAAIAGNSANLPGGAIKTAQGEVLLRTRSQAIRAAELGKLEVAARSDGARVLLEDVAEVIDGFADTGERLLFDGRPAALVRVSQVGREDLREIAEQVRRYVAQSGARHPPGVELTVWNDHSVLLADRLGTLLDSGLQGLLLVLVVLALFLRPHLALWVAAGIPIALFGAVFLLYLFGVSINAISLIGFILVLGMLVDDAVVVGESAYVAQRAGGGQLAGAVDGAQRVLVPVTFGVLTTVAAFLPMLYLTGVAGELMADVAAAVICCLAFSLIECQMILPAHLGHRSDSVPLGEFGMALLAVALLAAFALTEDARTGFALAAGAVGLLWAAHLNGALRRLGAAFARLQVRFEEGLQAFIGGAFRRVAGAALDARGPTIAAGVVAVGLAVAVVLGGHLPFSFLIADPGDRIVARLAMPFGSPESATDRALGQLSAAAADVKARLAEDYGESVVVHIVESRGAHLPAGALADGAPVGGHLGEVFLQLTPGEDRPIATDAVADLWRAAAGPIEGAQRIDFITDARSTPPDIDIRFYGEHLEDLRAASELLRAELANYPGVRDAASSFREGKEELSLSLGAGGAALGLTAADLGRQVRQAFHGEEARRVQRGEDDVRIMVRYPAAARRSLESLQALHIRTPGGAEAPLRAVAEWQSGRSLAAIERIGGARSVHVTAKVDLRRASANAIVRSLGPSLARIAAAYPGIGYEIESDKAMRETLAGGAPLFLAALFAMFALLAVPLRSYAQPLIIMAVLPFCFVGAVLGHLLMRVPGIVLGFSMPSLFGLIAASGVAINASLVLLHGVGRFLADGDSMRVALERAAVSRCRPVLITTATTFVGLLPLMLARSPSAAPMVPMVVSLAFGVAVSSLAALLFVPALYLALHDATARTRQATAKLGKLLGAAPRMAQWMARYPFVQESLRSQEFTGLLIEDDAGLDAETARIARAGLVRLYYLREFDRQAMDGQLDAIAARTPTTDDLIGEVRTWAQQRAFQLGAHMLRGAIAPVEAARPLADMLDACLVALLAAARRDCAAEHGAMGGAAAGLVALDAFGRRDMPIGGPLRLLFLYDCAPPPSADDAENWHGALLQRFLRMVRELSPQQLLFEPQPPWRFAADARGAAVYSLEAFESRCAQGLALGDLRALAHARVACADGAIGERFEAARREALGRRRDAGAVARELSALGARGRHGRWDVRERPGGLDDIARCVEYLQLTGAARAGAPATGLEETLDAADAAELSAAARLWRNFDGFVRMAGVDADPTSLTPREQLLLAQTCGATGFDDLPELLDATARRAAARVDALLGSR